MANAVLRAAGHHLQPSHYEKAFWRPPLHPGAAYALEAAQIRDVLHLRPMVAITDHDNMDACAELRTLGIKVPYAFEWTVPFGQAVFHLGIYNLPSEHARAFAAGIEQSDVTDTLAALHGMPGVLVVLNHPFNTELRLPREAHVEYLMRFLGRYRRWIHALELNGLQTAADNRDVLRLSAELGLPVVSGGDRHCLEPNANLNLTNAASFAEFVHEVRYEHRSHVLFLPQYREPVLARYIEFIWHAVKTYANEPGRERCLDRVFWEHPHNGPTPLSSYCRAGGPAVIRHVVTAMGILANPRMKATLRLALGQQGEIAA